MRGIWIALLIVTVTIMATTAAGIRIGWADEFGSGDQSAVWTVAADDGFVYAHGGTYGALPGQTQFGIHDVFLRKYDMHGSVIWTREFGVSGGLTFALGGNNMEVGRHAIYVAGYTDGALPGQTSSGGFDAFLRKYDRNGNVVWTRQFGTSADEDTGGVVVQGENIYVTGSTGAAFPGQSYAGGDLDGFLRKYDFNGNVVWTREFGTSGTDHPITAAAAGEGVYIGGTTDGTLPGQASAGDVDAFIQKYDRDGNLKWTRQFGSPAFDEVWGVAADEEGLYLHGDTLGTLPGQTNSGGFDSFVRKCSPRGKELWTRQYGTPGDDLATKLVVDEGTVYVTGATSGTFPGQRYAGGDSDAFVRTFDATGGPGLTFEFGTEGSDAALAIAVGEDGLVFVGGLVGGPIFGQSFSGGISGALIVEIFPEDG